jgi:hypothetical protein
LRETGVRAYFVGKSSIDKSCSLHSKRPQIRPVGVCVVSVPGIVNVQIKRNFNDIMLGQVAKF